MRPAEQIQRDLETVRATPLHRQGDGAYRAPAETTWAMGRLIDDIPWMLAYIDRLSRLRTDDVASRLATAAAAISRTVTESYRAGMDPELVMRRRLGKVNVEAGELWDAVEGWTGENPRKGVYAKREDVLKELIDCASASLCALEYMTGDRGDSVRMVAEQVAGNWTRLQAAMVDGGRG